ncbi:putative porin [Roseateles cellulosilyticus]|uniref:Porin n=1 Tax=Pelomonas cellulosilytica TaxID=2906762 RepID=A0ABS8XWA5_9BURK|nr:putative porin [Pelomonas sp. P8]MCE4556939.1 putative porin [Pelomonas sp. P8]
MKPILPMLTAALLAASLPAHADTADKEEIARLRATTQALIDVLVAQGLITRDKAEAILKQAQASAAAPAPQPQADASKPHVLRIPYVPETVRQQMRDEIKAEVLAQAKGERWGQSDAMPEWTGRIKVSGDLRVRAQGEFFDKDANVPAEVYRAQTASPAWAPDLTNTTTDRQRLTLRGRLEVDARLSDQVLASVRIATGGTGNSATSTSQTLGNDFNRYTLGLDRAYIRWQPPLFFNGVSADFGRMPNPFFSTDLAWPDDLAFDGVAAKLSQAFTPQRGLFATFGVFPLEELNLSTQDKWLLGGQVGGEVDLARGVQFKLGLAAYDFRHMEGQRESNPPPGGPKNGATNYFASQYAAGLRLKGNTLINLNDPTSTASPTWGLASKFRPVNLTASLQLDGVLPVPVGLTLDWIKNTGFDRKDIEARAGVPLTDLREKTMAAQARIQIGSPKLTRRGDWQAFTAYRMVQRDAWIDGFTDTTWHLGGTNYKGWSLGGNVGLDRNFWLSGRWTSTRNLDDGVRFLAVPGDPTSLSGNLSSAPLRIEVFQLDLNARF